MAADDRVPVTILTGFLGSGKTTLLNHVLTASHGKKIAVIENEFGEVGIDDELLQKNTKMQADEEIIEMMNGCICCTVRQDLIVILNKLAKRQASGKLKLDGIIIETTGMADPAPVAQTFFVDDAVKAFAKLDGIITLVDAKHVEQHLDEEKPEGAENEAVEQVAFADRILLNKTDLVSEEDLVRVEARIKAINAFAPIQRSHMSNVSVENVLNVGGFDLKRTLEMDPEFLNTDGEHEHDSTVTSTSITNDAEVDLDLVQAWVSEILQTKGADIFRMKGVLNIANSDKRFVYQAVHMIFNGDWEEDWKPDERRTNKLVFIGKNLDHAELRAGFAACVISPEVLQKKAKKKLTAQQLCRWAKDALPATFAGELVVVEEVRCPKPACPFETVLRVMLPKPKEFTIFKSLDAVTHQDVVAVMQAWTRTIERAKPVQAWAEQFLPKSIAGQRVMVDEVEVVHVRDKFETEIHILATPPWSMKVLKRLEDVTQKNIEDLMTYAALCGANGMPSVR